MNATLSSMLNYAFRNPCNLVDGPIRFAIGESTLGAILVGRSERGICAIFLGEDAQSVRQELIETFPTIELRQEQSPLQRELDLLIAHIENETPTGSMYFDVGGTPFQQKVWQALCDIPAGQTRSFSAVARTLGAPAAARAVARACAANLLAVAIPCHRVLRSDGSVSGYRWGIERKRALLAQESTKDSAI